LVAQRLPLAEVRHAHELLEKGGVTGSPFWTELYHYCAVRFEPAVPYHLPSSILGMFAVRPEIGLNPTHQSASGAVSHLPLQRQGGRRGVYEFDAFRHGPSER